MTQADDDFAIPLLAGVIARTPDLSQSFPFIKETLFSKVLESPQVVVDILSKKNGQPEKTVLIEMAGEIPTKQAVTPLLEILDREQEAKTIQTAITALGMIGDPAAEGSVSEFLYAGSREVVIAAVRAMGQIKTPGAIDHLSKRLGGDSEIDDIITDILAKADTPTALEKLNETLASSKADVRTAGKKKMLAVGVTALRVLIRNLSGNNTDLLIHSLNVLGDMGDAAAVPAIRKLLHNHPEDPNVRFAAYEALGKLPLDKGAFSLAIGLADTDGSVRAAAARAVDRHFNASLAAGLMNMIGTGDAEALGLVHTIIDTQCDSIVLGLWEENAFVEPASRYLSGKAHPDIRSHFKQLLADKGIEGLSEVTSVERVGEDRVRVFAVDDSKMILGLYRSVLHNLGYEPCLFEFPAGALNEIRKRKPAAVLTDLNMPDITGIDLTKGVRTLYSKEELPVIMVTSQDEKEDNEAAIAAGINSILQKPFTEEQLGAVLAEFVKA